MFTVFEESENKKLKQICEEKNNEVDHLNCENKEMRNEIKEMKEIIGKLEHKLQEQKQLISSITNGSTNNEKE